jgi:hypothetical protein
MCDGVKPERNSMQAPGVLLATCRATQKETAPKTPGRSADYCVAFAGECFDAANPECSDIYYGPDFGFKSHSNVRRP